MKVTEDRVYFWAGPLGNWSKVRGGIIIPAELGINGEEITVPTSEHVFMYLKARFFGDTDTATKIIKAESPKEAKRLGRLVTGFDDTKWEGYREEAMMTALKLRFEYDPRFREFLHSSRFKDKKFVEANPYDHIWSCGYLEDDPRIDMPESSWPGLNLLGKLLDRLRDETRISVQPGNIH